MKTENIINSVIEDSCSMYSKIKNLGLNIEKSLIPEATNTIQSLNPSSGKILGNIKENSNKEIDSIIVNAQESFTSWKSTPAPLRGELVRLIGNELRKYKDSLGTLVSLEMGKSKEEGNGEVQEMIDMADFAVGQSRMLYGSTMHSERPLHRMYDQWHPLGVVGIISAFNFPVAVWSWNAFISAICGNTTIWKPSEKTPLCAIAIQNICNNVMQKYGYKNIFQTIFTKNIDSSKQFVDDPRIQLISFTGSTKVGQEVGSRVAKRFGKCILELGGNNAMIIDETADLELAIPAAVFGAIGTAGQRCTTLRRLLIHEDIYDLVLKKIIDAYKQISIGDPLDIKNNMGPLIDQQAVENYLKTIQLAKKQGGTLVYGGYQVKRKGYFVMPTIMESSHDLPMAMEENFCPILYVMSYSNISRAIQINNNVKYGLSSSLFTKNIQNAEQFLSSDGSDCGIANINIGTSGAEIGGAFGGEKHTGGGREAGSDAWKTYMRRQTNTINYGNKLPLAQGINFNIR